MASLIAAVAPAMAVEPVGDPPAQMYQATTVNVVYLTLPAASEAALGSEPDEYVEGTFSLATTNGTPAGIDPPSAPITVGIRLKGQLGSKRSLAQKAAFKVKFSWVSGQKFLGLKKMTLNNMVQDPSSIHEALSYQAFRSSGVPASRTGYAYVFVNGIDYGLHLNVENVDDVATKKRFGDFEHVYEGAYGSDIETGPAPTPIEAATAAAAFEVDEGAEDDRSDLEALALLANGPVPPDWSQRLESRANLKEMTRMWAVEKYAGHWDGYSGIEGGSWPNNYYLQSDGEGWFRMLPWGVDQTWSSHLGFDGDAGVLFDRCLADASCAEMYRRSLREAQAAIAAEDLGASAGELASLIQPWIEKEQANSRHEFSLAQFQGEVQATRNFIAARPGELASWLATQAPEVPASDLSLALQPASISADGVSTTIATATVVDADGNPIPGDAVSFASSDGAQLIGPTIDNDDGTYSAQITASTDAGEVTIAAFDGSTSPHLVEKALLRQRPGPPARVEISLQPSRIPATASSGTTAKAAVLDAYGNGVPGQDVAFSSSDSGHRFAPVSEDGAGGYEALLHASPAPGEAIITATDRSAVPALTGAATLSQFLLSALDPPPPGAKKALRAQISGKPGHRTHDRTPTFRFGSEVPGSATLCRLDHGAFRPCASPLTLPRLALGRHTFAVKLVDRESAATATASYGFVIKPRKKMRHQ